MSRTPLKACWFASPSESAMRPSADDGALPVSSARSERASYATDQHRQSKAHRAPRWHHGSGDVGQWLQARGFGLEAIEYRAPERVLPACEFDAKRRVQVPAIVASKRRRVSQGFGQLASTGEADEPAPARHRPSPLALGCWCQHATKDDGHMARRHRGQPQSESPGSRTLDLPASPKGRGESALEVGGDPGRILVGRRRRTGLLVPRVRVLAVVQILGERRQLQRIEGVAHHGKLVRLRHPD